MTTFEKTMKNIITKPRILRCKTEKIISFPLTQSNFQTRNKLLTRSILYAHKTFNLISQFMSNLSYRFIKLINV